MAITNVASGKTIIKKVAELADTNNVFMGVAGGATETISTTMTANSALLLADQTSRFTDVTLKVNGTSGADTFSGTNNADVAFGLAGNDKLSGNGGNDTLDGGLGNDTLEGGADNDTLKGQAGNDVMFGDAGADTLDGGLGNDVMFGGLGDDVYIVDNINDKVAEFFGQGLDSVQTSVNYSLTAGVENLTLTGAAAINGTGNSLDNTITGNAKNNTLDGGAGNDVLNGGAGNDSLLGGNGADTLDGGTGADKMAGGDGNDYYKLDNIADTVTENEEAGTDTVEANFSYSLASTLENLTLTGTANIDGNGNAFSNTIIGNSGANVLDGGDGNDSLAGGAGNDILLGGDGNDTLDGGAGADLLFGGEGENTYVIEGDDTIVGSGGGVGSDTFVFASLLDDEMTIDGGVNEAGADDQSVDLQYFNGTSISTVDSSLGNALALDTVKFNVSGDFTNLTFTNIEQVVLSEGVSVTLDADMLTEAFDSTDTDEGSGTPGVHFYGTLGGVDETVTVKVTSSDTSFTGNSVTSNYLRGDFQLDDASIGDLFHNLDVVLDARGVNAASYIRIDGSNSTELVYGGDGVDNIDGRLGNDTIIGGAGNDLIKGQGGADSVDGGDGNDVFLIAGFESGVTGAYGKADDGQAEWVSGDVMIGGAGTDTLRITVGSKDAANGLIELTDSNFQGMEVVQVGGLSTRLSAENSDLQLLNNHYYHNAAGTVANTNTTYTDSLTSTTDPVVKNIQNVVVDASGITDTDTNAATGGLRFEGNGNINTFIGTQNNDTFVGNGGNDVLTGNDGADVFQFGKVHTMVANNTSNTYVDTATALTGADTITDFVSGTDSIALDNDFFAAFTATGAISADNLVAGSGAVAADANDFLLFDDATGALYYDADGSGAGSAVQFATLTGVTSVSAADFNII